MREALAGPQRSLATIHRVNKAALLVEITGHDLLH